ncbi:MAG: transcription antitermination factor NusB [Clostridia bacterium]|nr:transcription antitermination factor NusB [Clostridia bacterium]MBP3560410.1 transcription antitermination factor NusB [Clostridia bacterium]
MTRREAREQAFMVLFEKIFDEESTISEIVEIAKENELIKINNFAEALLKAVEDNSEEVDSVIEANLQDWTLSRLPKVSLAVLRLAVAEIKYIDEVPDGVAVNEAVELAKKYGTSVDASFINGVLGAVAKD